MENYDLNEFNKTFAQDIRTEKLLDYVEKEQRLLSTEEMNILADSLRIGRGFAVSDEELARLVNWALQIRLEGIFLDMILNRDADVNINQNGEIEFIERKK